MQKQVFWSKDLFFHDTSQNYSSFEPLQGYISIPDWLIGCNNMLCYIYNSIVLLWCYQF